MLSWDQPARPGVRRLHGVGVSLFALLLAVLLLPASLFAGGTPDPGTGPLAVDSGDADTLPDNENQLLGFLGPDRGFGFGDYVNDDIEGLQSTIGADASFDYYIEVPPGQGTLTVEIFDAEVGGGAVAGTELHDQENNTGSGWTMQSVYTLIAPNGTPAATITLPGQDCDPVTVGLQTGCDNAWSDLGVFTVANPAPGHWRFRVQSPNTGITDEDDNNSFGLRAHDGDATAGGTEYAVYADTYVGIGQVYSTTNAAAGLSRTHDFFPWIANGCTFDSNDWDTDANGDEEISLTPPRPPTGTPALFTVTPSSGGTVWNQDVVSGWTTDQDATNYGLWSLRWLIGEFNFITYSMGDESAADPSNAAPGPGNGQEPNQQPEPGAVRLYLPADGSRFFGERGGPDDVVLAPQKPWVGQSWQLLPGEPPLEVGTTSRVRVTITVANPTALPIQFSATAAGSAVIRAEVPSNGGQTVYVPGSATIVNPSGAASTATAEIGAGPVDLTFAPGVVDPGVTATLTYDIDVTPTVLGTLSFSGSGATGTRGSFLDGACADLGGGPSACDAVAVPRATSNVGPLCPLAADVTSAPAIGLAKRISSPVTDNGNGTFNVGFTFVIENLGNVTLDPVAATEDLSALFAPTGTFAVSSLSASLTSGTGALIENLTYDGAGDTNMLDAASVLDPGDVGEIVLQITFDPNQEPGPFVNQAFASGTTPGGGSTSDPSDDGTDPDTDGDGNADEDAGAGTCPSTSPADQCENDPTVFGVPDDPSIGAAKRVVSQTDNGSGTFDVTFAMLIENLGNVDLLDVQAVEGLNSTFPAPATFSVVSLDVTAPPGSGIAARPGFDGSSVLDLLTDGDLGPGETVSITLVVRVDPQDGPCDGFTNQIRVSAASPQSAPAEATFDFSDNGSLVDPDGDGNANETSPGCPSTVPGDQCENDATPIDLVGTPSLGVAKRLVSQVTQPGGTVLLDFEFVVENLGSLFLSDLGVTDDLVATFPAPATFTVTAGPTATGTLTANAGYDGAADTQLLDTAASSLTPGNLATITLQVELEPNVVSETYFNQAFGSASSCLTAASDPSDDGSDPDPNGDGNADQTGENDPTPITIDLGAPGLMIDKTLVDLIDEGDGTFTASFLLTLDNTGPTDLEQVSAIDDLDLAFPAPASVLGVSTVTASGTLTANAAYDGTTDPELLVPASSTLPLGASETVSFDVTFDPGGETEFVNTVDASAASPAGQPVDATDSATVTIDGSPLEIPTLGGWGLALLAALLGLAGVGRMRRRR
ncbi:MAG: IPTL-CTERM sorting domain-containing protein [Acidobacteriota bacterium]